jgi:hypothetical protein
MLYAKERKGSTRGGRYVIGTYEDWIAVWK